MFARLAALSAFGAAAGITGSFFLSRRDAPISNEAVLRGVALALRSRTLARLAAMTVAFVLLSRRVVGDRLGATRRWIGAATLIMWIASYRLNIVERPVVRCRATMWNRALVEKARLAQERYWPCFWMFSGHASTVLGSLIGDFERFVTVRCGLRATRVRWRREVLPGFDRKPLLADWAEHTGEGSVSDASELGPGAPVIILLHGIAGCSTEPYVTRFADVCLERSWRPVSFDYWRLDFADDRDLTILINAISARYPDAPILAVGFSAGGHVLLRYLARVGDNSPLLAAALVSHCGCLHSEYLRTESCEPGGIYHRFFDRAMNKCARRHVNEDPSCGEREERLLQRTKEAYPRAVAFYDAFVHGLSNASHGAAGGRVPEWLRPLLPPGAMSPEGYVNESLLRTPWRGNASASEAHTVFCQRSDDYVPFTSTAAHYLGTACSKLDQVKVSTLILHARNDPVVTFDGVCWEDAIANRHIISVMTRRGGHVTFPQGMTPFGHSFADSVLERYLSGVLELTASTRFAAEVVLASIGDRRGSFQQPHGLANATSLTDFNSQQRRRALSLTEIARVSSRTSLPTADGKAPEERPLTF